jgi:hypothetical protein
MAFSKVTHVSLVKFKHDRPYEDQNCELTLSQEDEYRDGDGACNRVHEMPKVKVIGAYAHEDLLLAFSRLSSHLAMLCEFFPPKPYFNPEDNDRVDQAVYATGLSMKGTGDSCIITGFRSLKDGTKLSLAVSTSLDNPLYEHNEALMELCELILAEGVAALRGKRKLSGQQMEMEFPGASGDAQSSDGDAPVPSKRSRMASADDDLGF